MTVHDRQGHQTRGPRAKKECQRRVRRHVAACATQAHRSDARLTHHFACVDMQLLPRPWGFMTAKQINMRTCRHARHSHPPRATHRAPHTTHHAPRTTHHAPPHYYIYIYVYDYEFMCPAYLIAALFDHVEIGLRRCCHLNPSLYHYSFGRSRQTRNNKETTKETTKEPTKEDHWGMGGGTEAPRCPSQ